MRGRIRHTAPLLALLAAVAGCGSQGGGQGGSSTAAATAAAGGGSVGLVAYLAQVEPRDKQLNQLRAAVLRAVDGVNVQRPDASWTRAEKRLEQVTAGLDRLSVSIARIEAPPALKRAHHGLAESVAVLESYVYDLQNALGAKIPTLLTTAANEDSTRIAVLRGTWEAAVATYAKRLGVTLPAWLGGPGFSA